MNWAGRTREAPLVLSVLEDKAGFDREVRIFTRTLGTWLGGAGVLLLLALLLLLRWGLRPLRHVSTEIRRVRIWRTMSPQERSVAKFVAIMPGQMPSIPRSLVGAAATEALGGLSDEVLTKVLHDNAASLYCRA